MRTFLPWQIPFLTAVVVLAAVRPAAAQEPRPPGPFEVPRLIEEVKDGKDAGARYRAALDLWRVEHDYGAVPVLIEAIEADKNGEGLAAWAIEVLENPGPEGKAALPALTAALKAKSGRRRAEAALAVWRIAKSPDVFPVLEEGMKGDDRFVREAAMNSLGKIGRDDKAAVLLLADALKNKDKDVRFHAAYELVQSGPGAKAAAPALIEALKDPYYLTRQVAAEVLGGAEVEDRDAILALADAFANDKDGNVARAAVVALARLGPRAKAAVPALAGVVRTKDGRLRAEAALALWRIEKNSDAVPVLAELLGNPNSDVRRQAALNLGAIGAEAAPAVPALEQALGDKVSSVRVAALQTLGGMKQGVKEIQMTFNEARQGKDVSLTMAAVDALAAFGPEAKEAIPALAEMVKDPKQSPRVVERAAVALVRIDPTGKESFPVLLAALKEAKGDARDALASAVGDLGPTAKDAIPVLIDVFKDYKTVNVFSPHQFSVTAAEALAKIGPDAVPALAAELKEKDPALAFVAARTLGSMGAGARKAVPALIEALGDTDNKARWKIAEALGGVGPDAKEAVPALVKTLRDMDPRLGLSAAAALYRIAKDPAVVPFLTDVLKDKDAAVRYGAVALLGEMGADARDALPALKAVRRDEKDYIRALAEESLKRIDPDGAPE